MARLKLLQTSIGFFQNHAQRLGNAEAPFLDLHSMQPKLQIPYLKLTAYK